MATYIEPQERVFGDDILPEDWNRDVVNNIIALHDLVPEATPPGVLLPYAGAAAPAGWLLCYGQAVSRSGYAALFAIIGTVYGVGDGSTTFNLPDLRGRMPLGKDNMGGTGANRVTATQADNIGQGAGEENHTLTTTEMPAHTHNQLNKSGATYFKDGTGGTGQPVGANTQSGLTDNTTLSATGSAGSGGAHNNMPPYLTLNYLIKT